MKLKESKLNCNKSSARLILIICIFFVAINKISSSNGDGSIVFTNCLRNCLYENCTDNKYRRKSSLNNLDSEVEPFENRQPYYLKLLGWDCTEECKYDCMWFENFYEDKEDLCSYEFE